MASTSDEGPKPSRDRVSAKSTADPILRNALRYTISPKEYETLHKFIISRSKVLQRNAPTVARVEKLLDRPGRDDYNAAAVRASLRVFLATGAALKAWGAIKERFLGGDKLRGRKASLWKSPNFRLSLSLSAILLLHRILFRFFTRLRAHLLTPEARPFRQRNKRTSRTLTSTLAPAVGASLAGFMLAVYPADQLRAYGDFILKYSPQYVQTRPEDYPASLPWPSTRKVVDNLAEVARLNYPPFISPILFPNSTTLPASLVSISPITSPAHPLIASLTCATLHPSDPSCLRTYLTYWLRVFPSLTRFFTAVFLVLSLPSYKRFYRAPITTLNNLASRILLYSSFVAGSIGTSWGAICFFQQLLPRHFLATQRFFLGGMLGGLWGFIVRRQARGEFLQSARASIDSLWKVGRKRGWWRGVRGGDVWLFVCSLMVINVVYERDARSLRSGVVRKGVSGLRGEGFKDCVEEEEMRVKEE
ncbi:hypothetical protein M7I_1546 [Glarea lozoyensis 74030]|uniref:Transmembrane protein 135 N-terminal domain-containing protein n=1 Tax=Glarea lozoyensis (strain ATCC 74030 / MF5533) TaxID=1104152 RepID=H0EGD0_GLAL7|nr:hypothetical protein M7I_1546 [Glarea lozoyensis 74030]